jgi:hypothetical protein
VTESEKPEGWTKLIVYWCHSVEHGPEHRVYDEGDIQAAGGICGVEMELQRDSYWFVPWGVIEAKKEASGWSYEAEAIAALPEPDPEEWSLGRHNPAPWSCSPRSSVFPPESRKARLIQVVPESSTLIHLSTKPPHERRAKLQKDGRRHFPRCKDGALFVWNLPGCSQKPWTP